MSSAGKTGCDPTTFFDSVAPAAETRASYSDFPFTWGEVEALFRTARRLPGSYFRKLEETRGKAREFAERYVRPAALEIERRVSEDHNYFAWDLMKQACKYRFFSMIIPEAFEGVGLGVLHMAAMAEEVAAGCAGVASTIGVHSAGISCGLLSLDAYVLEKYIRPVARAEKRGEPVLWGGAVTEPLAGTDIWDEDFLKLGKIVTFAKKVPGGYRLTGRKCFISNGSVARWIVVAGALDPKAVAESWTGFLVDTKSPGFSVGRVERKMGQKASPAAELIMEDVFVPAECRLGSEGKAGRFISIYLAGSRGPVGAIGVGCACRSLECLIEWAQQKRARGGRMIDQQAVQLAMARMSSEIAAARSLYVASCLFNDELFYEMIGGPVQRAALALLPHSLILRPSGRAVLQSATVRKAADWALSKIVPDDRLAFISRLATAAKVVGSETGVRVSGEAARLMGPDALDPRWPVEKAWRDAKLTMIYEGTNQANLITHFKDTARTLRRS
ncbi:MAG TPA: acyl-CoA dehydrogenase family protein [bacterium]|nr:acyl-CoA dehydrogenase family protein [bacterium]